MAQKYMGKTNSAPLATGGGGGGDQVVWHGSCSTSAATIVKDVTSDLKDPPAAGTILYVTFRYAPGSANVTENTALRINGGTPRGIRLLGANTPGSALPRIPCTLSFVFNGTAWDLQAPPYKNTLNGTDQPDRLGIYAPTTSGTAGQVLTSNGENQVPTWSDPTGGGGGGGLTAASYLGDQQPFDPGSSGSAIYVNANDYSLFGFRVYLTDNNTGAVLFHQRVVVPNIFFSDNSTEVTVPGRLAAGDDIPGQMLTICFIALMNSGYILIEQHTVQAFLSTGGGTEDVTGALFDANNSNFVIEVYGWKK